MEEKIVYLKEIFDKFLKDNGVYDAWYERYRLDNLMYDDEVPIENFFEQVIEKGERSIHSMLYTGISGTCMCTQKGCDFIEKNKQCDILSNGLFADLDGKWMDTWRTLVDMEKLK